MLRARRGRQHPQVGWNCGDAGVRRAAAAIRAAAEAVGSLRCPRLRASGRPAFEVGDMVAHDAAMLAIARATAANAHLRSEEHTSELQSLMRISYAVFCLKK